MINLRYHVVSITAVFLALGIGLVFGAAFIDRATVEALNRNLTDIEAQNRDLEEVNGELSRRLAVATDMEEGLRREGFDQLMTGQLSAVPILMLAADGVGEAAVESVEAAVVASGAAIGGVLRVTDRFLLDDDAEVDDLRTVLDLPTAAPGRLRTATIRQLRTLLLAAAEPIDPGTSLDDVPAPVSVPELIAALIEAGFFTFDVAENPPASFALVPEGGLRILIVSGPDAELADRLFLLPLIDLLVSPRPTDLAAPPPLVVAAQPAPTASDEETDPSHVPFVEVLRADEDHRSLLSTIDHVDSFAGLTAMVLALQHGAEGQLGHYGIAEDAQSLLPPPVVAPESGD